MTRFHNLAGMAKRYFEYIGLCLTVTARGDELRGTGIACFSNVHIAASLHANHSPAVILYCIFALINLVAICDTLLSIVRDARRALAKGNLPSAPLK